MIGSVNVDTASACVPCTLTALSRRTTRVTLPIVIRCSARDPECLASTQVPDSRRCRQVADRPAQPGPRRVPQEPEGKREEPDFSSHYNRVRNPDTSRLPNLRPSGFPKAYSLKHEKGTCTLIFLSKSQWLGKSNQVQTIKTISPCWHRSGR